MNNKNTSKLDALGIICVTVIFLTWIFKKNIDPQIYKYLQLVSFY